MRCVGALLLVVVLAEIHGGLCDADVDVTVGAQDGVLNRIKLHGKD